jgi:hypothetical protein
VHQVADWLNHFGLVNYQQLFVSNEINGSLLLCLTEWDLKEMGMTTKGDLMKVVEEMERLKSVSGTVVSLFV